MIKKQNESKTKEMNGKVNFSDVRGMTLTNLKEIIMGNH